MWALQVEYEHNCREASHPTQLVDKGQYSFTIVVMNKFTGEVIETIKYKQVLIPLEERNDLDEY